MAILHRADLRPPKLELVAGWAPTQPWGGAAAGTELEQVAAYRFDDPAGEVGVETFVVRARDVLLHVPLTYAAPWCRSRRRTWSGRRSTRCWAAAGSTTPAPTRCTWPRWPGPCSPAARRPRSSSWGTTGASGASPPPASRAAGRPRTPPGRSAPSPSPTPATPRPSASTRGSWSCAGCWTRPRPLPAPRSQGPGRGRTSRSCWPRPIGGAESGPGDPGSDLGAQQLDAAQQVGVRQARVGHLDRDAVDPAHLLGDPQQLVGHGVRVAHEEGAVGTAGGVELRPRGAGEATLAGDLGEHLVPAGVDRVGRDLRALRDV